MSRKLVGMFREYIKDSLSSLCCRAECYSCRVKFESLEKLQNIVFKYIDKPEKVETVEEGEKDVPDVMCAENYPLSKDGLEKVYQIKTLGNEFYDFLDNLSISTEMEIAKTKLEEVIMWAVKGICICNSGRNLKCNSG